MRPIDAAIVETLPKKRSMPPRRGCHVPFDLQLGRGLRLRGLSQLGYSTYQLSLVSHAQ
jgi:hypothetical protein